MQEQLPRSTKPVKHMSDAVVRSVEPLCVLAIEITHPSGKVGIWSLNQNVIVIAHQTIRVTDPVHTLAYVTKQPKKRLPIIISFVDVLASVTPGRDVIKRPFKLQSNRSGHPPTLHLKGVCGNTRPVDPIVSLYRACPVSPPILSSDQVLA